MDETWIVGLDWLADSETAVPVDVRDDWEYEAIGHVPGARSIPFDSFRDADTETPGMLPDPDTFAETLGAVGIDADDTLVAYDDGLCVFAARFVVTARLLGHTDARLLAGDFTAWGRAHESSSDPSSYEPTNYDHSALVPDTSPLVARADVEAAIDGPAVIVDTREPTEFAEGHIPGATRFDWRDLMDEERRVFHSTDRAREILEAAGILPDRQIVLYCNTARRISHTYVALRALGYDDVAFYEGSLTDWEAAGGRVVTDD